jgi:hypothetical protein
MAFKSSFEVRPTTVSATLLNAPGDAQRRFDRDIEPYQSGYINAAKL